MLAFLLEVFGVLISGLSAAAAGRLGVTSRGKRLWPSWGAGASRACFALPGALEALCCAFTPQSRAARETRPG